jgi:hypothetical protein
MPLHSNFTSHSVKFGDRIRNCEDAVLVPSRRVAILACDPGRDTWNTVMVCGQEKEVLGMHLTVAGHL